MIREVVMMSNWIEIFLKVFYILLKIFYVWRDIGVVVLDLYSYRVNVFRIIV